MASSDGWKLTRSGDELQLQLQGRWRLRNLPQLYKALTPLDASPSSILVLDGSQLQGIDTSGAHTVYKELLKAGFALERIKLANFSEEHRNILLLVAEQFQDTSEVPEPKPLTLMQDLGKASIDFVVLVYDICAFLGETICAIGRAIIRPRLLRVKETFVQLELVCMNAVPVVILVTFLVGVVIAYLFSIQSEKYGANIFIVDALALAMSREFSPILVAIILAGRSGSAFTAQIGSMKLNEEIDSIVTLGLSPMQVLVLPRLFALMLAMPLLVFVGDIAGIAGGMMIADMRLGITAATFVDRLQTVLPLQSFFVGLIKAPVFASFIAVIGCRLGLAVENNARSVGLNTTATVVQSIVSVILLNAAFAVIFVELGI